MIITRSRVKYICVFVMCAVLPINNFILIMSICGKFCASHFHKKPPLLVNELATFIYSQERHNIIMLLLLLTLPTSVVLPNIIANLSERDIEKGGEIERDL